MNNDVSRYVEYRLVQWAIRIQYVSNKAYKERAMEMNVSYSQFKIFVEMARQWLSGRLSANIKKIKSSVWLTLLA